MDNGKRTVRLDIPYDEALVLFDWSHRHEDENYGGPFFRDHAEEIAIWNLTARLEPLIDEVFNADYGDVVNAAKSRLVGETGLELRAEEP